MLNEFKFSPVKFGDNKTLTQHKIGWITFSFLKFSQVKDMANTIIGSRNYFILKRYTCLTTSIFIGSASTVHKLLKIMF